MAGLFIMMLPSIMTYEGVPHALRTIGTIPFAMILAGLGFEAFYQWLLKLHQTKDLGLLSIRILIFIVLAAIAIFEFHKYFIAWASNNNVAGAFANYSVRIGEELNAQPPQEPKYVIVNEPGVLVKGLPMPAQTVMFVAYKAENVNYLLPENINQLKSLTQAVIIPLKFDKQILKQIEQQVGQQLKVRLSERRVFVLTLKK